MSNKNKYEVKDIWEIAGYAKEFESYPLKFYHLIWLKAQLEEKNSYKPASVMQYL